MDNRQFWKEMKEMEHVSVEKSFPELELLNEFIDVSQEMKTPTISKEIQAQHIKAEENPKPVAEPEPVPEASEPAAVAESAEHVDTAVPEEDMQAEIQVLKDEIAQLRNQIENNSYDIYVVPKNGQDAGVPQLLASQVGPSADGAVFAAPGFAAVPAPEGSVPSAAEKPAKKKYAWIGEVAFYLFLILIIAGAILVKSNSGGRPITIAGFSAFTVLTSSMESEIPKGSLVIVKDTDPKMLAIGDDITYMVSETTSVTHRIIGIHENYQNTGQRGFETKGVMNPEPDKEIVAAANVVGRVVFHNKALGMVGGFINNNWPFLIFAAVVIFGLTAFLKWNFRQIDEEEKKKQTGGTQAA